jgi:hypothetical protein
MAFGLRGQYYKYREFSLNLLALYKQRADVQAFLEIILSLATLIVFIVFAIKPTILTMVSLNKEISAKQAVLDGLNQKITDLQTANNVYRENQAIIPDIDSAIFSSPRPDSISKQVLGIAAKNSVTIIGLSLGSVAIVGQGPQSKDASDLKPLPNGALPLGVTINIKGDYQNILAFLIDIEKLRIPIKMDTLSINTSKLASETFLNEFVSARIPYLKNQ